MWAMEGMGFLIFKIRFSTSEFRRRFEGGGGDFLEIENPESKFETPLRRGGP
jgi:hypothetical protein